MSTPVDPIAEAHRQWRAHGWTDAADGMAMVTSIARAHQLLSERIEGLLRPLDLTFARFEILRLLAFSRNGAMPMTRLGSLLQVHPASVTSAVDRLQAQGFVERLRREQDRRVILASITTEGRDIVEMATTILNQAAFTSPGLDPSEVSSLTDLIANLRANAGDTVQSRANT
jgi:DNA-binding MarR family transcriptional regulator